MDKEAIKKIVSKVDKRFPEVAGSKPKVRLQASPKDKSSKSGANYLLTFHSKVQSNGDKTISRWVRVVADNNGKIIKITTSR